MFKKFLNLLCFFMILFSFTPVSFAVTNEQMSYIKEFSKKINVPSECFLFDVKSNAEGDDSQKTTKCALVPIRNIDDHKKCMKAMLGEQGDEEYIKYYNDGCLSDDNTVEKKVERDAAEMKCRNPKTFTFIITYGDESVGKAYVISMCSGDKHVPMVGYLIRKEYSGKGITKASVKCILNIMQRIVNNKDKRYSFTKLKATAAPANKASNAILSKLGFKKARKQLVEDTEREMSIHISLN